MRLSGFALVVVLAACGGTPRPSEPAVAPAQGPAMLTLGEMRLVDVASNTALLIHADGSLEANGKTPAKVTVDGRVIATSTGEPLFQLQPDGRIKDLAYDKMLGATLGADGSLVVGTTTFALDASGELIGRDASAPKIRFEGATSVALKRTAMFVFVVLMVTGDSKSTEE